jgi:hypothetical protein
LVTASTLQQQGTGAGSSTTVPSSTSSTSTLPSTTTATTVAKSSACAISAIETIIDESASADQARTSSWSILQANGWTVFAPSGDWHLSASDGGADVLSPDGLSDASLASWPSLTAWSYTSLGAKILGNVSDIKIVCRTPSETGPSGSSELFELTGVYEGEAIHAAVALSILNETSSGDFEGQTRSVYTPASEWTPANAQTLWLIIKRAIFAPSP